MGIGNCGRGDDGLGWQFVESIQQGGNTQFDFEYRYQLQIEDSIIVSEHELVIFVDASHEKLEKGFEIKPCNAVEHYFYSSHMQSPETILYLTGNLFDKYPEAYTIAIEGHYWELKTTISKQAERRLQSALAFFENDFLPLFQTRQPLLMINK